jgi:hypothetical protein
MTATTQATAFVIPTTPDLLPAWDASGTRILVQRPDALVVLRVAEPTVEMRLAPPSFEEGIWSPRGEAVAVTRAGRTVVLRAEAGGAELWAASDGKDEAWAMEAMAWSLDGSLLASLYDVVVVRDAMTGSLAWTHARTREVDHAAGRRPPGVKARIDVYPVCPVAAGWSPDSSLLAVSWDDQVVTVHARDGKVVHESTLSGPEGSSTGGRPGFLRWTSWGRAVYEAGRNRLAECEGIGGLAASDPWRQPAVLSDDGRFAACEGSQHVLYVRDEDGTVRSIPGHPRTIVSLAFSPAGVLATLCRDGVLRRLDNPRGELEECMRLDADACRGQLLWSPRGDWLLATSLASLTAIPMSPRTGLTAAAVL